MNLKGIYLGAGRASVSYESDITYQDINNKRDIGGDMMDIDLSNYDFIIATPPCNYWSVARGNRCSLYSLNTKHLLPDIIDKLIKLGKPFIVENVKNNKRFNEHGLLNKPCNIYQIGRHTYWTNIFIAHPDKIEQRQDFKTHGKVIKYGDMTDLYHQGGYNVNKVITQFIKSMEKLLEE